MLQPKANVAKPKEAKPKSQEGAVCFHCNEIGHWRRNCKKYKEALKKGKDVGSTSGIFVIDIFLSTSSSWVLDTGCGSHICLNVQGLKNRRILEDGEVDLRVGNGAKVAALAVGTYEVTLPSGLLLVLNNCYYVPALSRNIISISCLDNEGFNFLICDKKFSISQE